MSSFIHKVAQRNTIILKLCLSGVYWIGNEPKELFFICKNDKSQNYCTFRFRFRLPQRSHLRTLENFVSEKSGNVVRNRENVVKTGEALDKIGKPGNFKEVHLFSCIRA